jgi:hypothetical protein
VLKYAVFFAFPPPWKPLCETGACALWCRGIFIENNGNPGLTAKAASHTFPKSFRTRISRPIPQTGTVSGARHTSFARPVVFPEA